MTESTGRIVIVCGGRDFTDREALFAALDAHHALDPIGCVFEGGQRIFDRKGGIIGGADGLAHEWAASRRISCLTFSAEWHTFGSRAGPMRNQKMLDAGAVAVIAFPGGRGTADMVRRARAAGVFVDEIKVRA